MHAGTAVGRLHPSASNTTAIQRRVLRSAVTPATATASIPDRTRSARTPRGAPPRWRYERRLRRGDSPAPPDCEAVSSEAYAARHGPAPWPSLTGWRLVSARPESGLPTKPPQPTMQTRSIEVTPRAPRSASAHTEGRAARRGIGKPTRHPRWHGSAPVTGTGDRRFNAPAVLARIHCSYRNSLICEVPLGSRRREHPLTALEELAGGLRGHAPGDLDDRGARPHRAVDAGGDRGRRVHGVGAELTPAVLV